MKKLSYVFSHVIFKILVGIFIVCVLTFFIDDTLLQLNSQKNGIEIILYDTTLSVSDPKLFCKQIKKDTSVRYVNFTTVESTSTEEYVSNIQNYTVCDYLAQLAASRDAELLVVPEAFLERALTIKDIVPLELPIESALTEKCSLNGVIYAFPFEDKLVTDYGDAFASAYQHNVYGILLSGDHTQQMRDFLSAID